MTKACSVCGKEYPLEQLSFAPDVEQHIRNLATGKGEDPKVKDEDMHKLYCPDCLKKLRG